MDFKLVLKGAVVVVLNVTAPNFGDYAVAKVWADDPSMIASAASVEARHEDDLPERYWAFPNVTFPGFFFTTTPGHSGTFATTCAGLPHPL